MIIFLIVLYSLVAIGISLWYRRHSTGDEYLMGDRKASAVSVAAGLFTLVGGGELVTLTALSFTYGYAGIALFLGYALGFVFLGIISPRIRKGNAENYHLSLPDYVHQYFGRRAGQVVFLISFAAFFSMLLIQFTAGGQVLSSISALSYTQSIIITAVVCIVYLLIGGFKTVLATDVVQGIGRLILMPLLVFVAAKGITTGSMSAQPAIVMPAILWISLVVTGFFAASSSADVWQRIYAAKSDRAAKVGLWGGGVLLVLFGFTLVALGIIARSSGQITNADAAFTQAITSMLPYWAVLLAVILVVSTIMSTADTEMFLLSGMTQREILRLKGANDPDDLKSGQSVIGARILMVFITIGAVLLSLVFRELVPIYTWLLSTLLIIAPMIIASLFLPNNAMAAKASLYSNLILFCILAYFGFLTPDNSYLIVIPGLLIYVAAYFLTPKSGPTNLAPEAQ